MPGALSGWPAGVLGQLAVLPLFGDDPLWGWPDDSDGFGAGVRVADVDSRSAGGATRCGADPCEPTDPAPPVCGPGSREALAAPTAGRATTSTAPTTAPAVPEMNERQSDT